MAKLKVLVFGNLLIKKDNLPLKLLPKLKKEFSEIEFLEIDAIEIKDTIEKEKIRNLIILDTVDNINKIKLIEFNSHNDFNKLKTEKIYSLHDFDLGYELKLLKKLKKIDKVKIIGVPMNMKEKEALKEIGNIINNLNN